jgi:hypothetical protein
LSRACLGKLFVFTYKWRKKTGFTHQSPTRCPPRSRLARSAPCAGSSGPRPPTLGSSHGRLPAPAPAPRMHPSFFEFSLCLSRACLGKMIVFIYKWLQKAVFCTGNSDTHRHECSRPSTLRNIQAQAAVAGWRAVPLSRRLPSPITSVDVFAIAIAIDAPGASLAQGIDLVPYVTVVHEVHRFRVGGPRPEICQVPCITAPVDLIWHGSLVS